MTRDRHSRHPARQQNMRTRIAAAAARMMAEDGIEDFATAKRKAARLLGASDTQMLPGNDEVEAELRLYQSLYQADEQHERIVAMREIALDAMEALAQFRPWLTGPVLAGTAARFSDIDLMVYPDDPKLLEMHLINLGVDYATETPRRGSGDAGRAGMVLRFEWSDVPVRLAVFAPRDERNAPRAAGSTRAPERAGLDAVRAMVHGTPGGDA